MRKLITLIEDIVGQDDNDVEFEASATRERHIEKMIRYAFDKLGLQINSNSYSVRYEDSNREANISLEDDANGIALSKLLNLYNSGLAKDYHIENGDSIRVTFIVSEGLEDASIPTD